MDRQESVLTALYMTVMYVVRLAFYVLLGLYVLIWRKDLFWNSFQDRFCALYSIIFAAFAKITAPTLNNQSYVRKYMECWEPLLKQMRKADVQRSRYPMGLIPFAGLMFAGFYCFYFMLQKKGISDMRDDMMISMLLYGYQYSKHYNI